MTKFNKDPQYHFRNWLIKAPLGLTLIGMGLCLVAEGALQKYDGAPTLNWVLYGTFALIVVNAGISIFGGAVVHRGHFERLKEQIIKKEE